MDPGEMDALGEGLVLVLDHAVVLEKLDDAKRPVVLWLELLG